MSTYSFRFVLRQLLQLYSRRAYSQALDLIEREQKDFPQPGLLYHWKMCLAARLNDTEHALRVFSEALECGYVYSSQLICEDEDLQLLQDLPEYAQLVSLSLQRFAEAEVNARSEMLVVPPEGGFTNSPPLLLAIHGDTQNARCAAIDWQPLQQKGWMLVCPQSSRMISTDTYIWDDPVQGAMEVQELYQTFIRDHAIDHKRIIVCGFSKGASVALQLAITGVIKARGFILVGPHLRHLHLLTSYIETMGIHDLRGYIVLGLLEPLEIQYLVYRAVTLFNKHGLQCEIEKHFGLAHDFPSDFVQSLERALAFLL